MELNCPELSLLTCHPAQDVTQLYENLESAPLKEVIRGHCVGRYLSVSWCSELSYQDSKLAAYDGLGFQDIFLTRIAYCFVHALQSCGFYSCDY